MSLKTNVVMVVLLVTFVGPHSLLAAPMSPEQIELNEAMKSGDQARIQKAIGALTNKMAAGAHPGKPQGPAGGGMPVVSTSDRALINSAEGKRILAKHAQLSKSNSKAASDIEVKALQAKAVSDWHKQHPKEKREPTTQETYQPLMRMQMNPEIRQLALVQYYPGMERQQRELAEAQANISHTPYFDKLTPEEKLAVEWQVRQRYKDLHSTVPRDIKAPFLDGREVFSIHGVDGSAISEKARDEFEDEVKKHHRTYYSSTERPIQWAIDKKKMEIDQKYIDALPDNPSAFKKWRFARIETIAKDSNRVMEAVKGWQADQTFESDEKSGKHAPIDPRNLRYFGPQNEDQKKAEIAKRHGCDWVDGKTYVTEKNPSALCDAKGGPQGSDRDSHQSRNNENVDAQTKVAAEQRLTAEKEQLEHQRSEQLDPKTNSSVPASLENIEPGALKPDMISLGAYSLGKYEVTVSQWRAIMGDNFNEPRDSSWCGADDCPVTYITWDDVQTFLTKLNQKTGKHYRLPTEKEWLQACDKGKDYCGGTQLDSIAWYTGNAPRKPHSVGQKHPNAKGLYDMTGNVWEMTDDCYAGSKKQKNCNGYVVMGGSFTTFPKDLYVKPSPGQGIGNRAYLPNKAKAVVNNQFGFRLALTNP